MSHSGDKKNWFDSLSEKNQYICAYIFLMALIIWINIAIYLNFLETKTEFIVIHFVITIFCSIVLLLGHRYVAESIIECWKDEKVELQSSR